MFISSLTDTPSCKVRLLKTIEILNILVLKKSGRMHRPSKRRRVEIYLNLLTSRRQGIFEI